MLLGGHKHLIICHICQKMEDYDEDTIYDMWMNDNITNNFRYVDGKNMMLNHHHFKCKLKLKKMCKFFNIIYKKMMVKKY